MSGAWSWYSHLSDAFKRRVGRYLINRYLGPFLEEGILLNQLSVTTGCPITLNDVALNTKNINNMLEDSEVPVEFVDGYIKELSVSVPWSNLLKDNCQFVIDGLTITLQVKKRENPHQISASIFHSMCESFSSINVAEDCLASSDTAGFESPRSCPSSPKMSSSTMPSPKDHTSSMPGVAILAEAIDSIVMRVQVQLTNTIIRIEYVPTSVHRGMAIELKVANVNYSGEIQGQNSPQHGSNFSAQSNPAGLDTNTMTSSTLKKILIEGVQLFSDEFTYENERISPACSRIESSSRIRSSSSEHDSCDSDSDNDTNTCGSRTPSPNSSYYSRGPTKNVTHLQTLQLAALTGRNELVLRFSETDHFGLPRSIEEIELNLGGICLHVYPHQIHTLKEILSAITVTKKNDPDTMSLHPSMLENAHPSSIKFGASNRIRLKDPKKDTELSLRLETLLQAEMMQASRYGLSGASHQAIDPSVGGWSEIGGHKNHQANFPKTCDESFSSTRSSDFQEMSNVPQPGMDKMNPFAANQAPIPTPTPKIVIKLVSIVGILIERDEGVKRLNIDKLESTTFTSNKETNMKFKSAAMERMIKVSTHFFQVHASGRQQPGPTLWNSGPRSQELHSSNQKHSGNLDRLGSLHARLDYSASWSGSHIQFVGTPLTISYEEKSAVTLGNALFSGTNGFISPSDYLSKTTVTIGQLSIKEVLDLTKGSIPLTESNFENDKMKLSKNVVDILTFKSSTCNSSEKRFSNIPDFKLVYKESLVDENEADMSSKGLSRNSNSPLHTSCEIEISLNPCLLEFDPGLVDRTYMLANYAELDPDCLFTPSYEDLEGGNLNISQEKTISDLSVKLISQEVIIKFWVPRADMRMPNMDGFSFEEFVSSFWSRSIHPELFLMTLLDMKLDIFQEGNPNDSIISPLSVTLSSNYADIKFQENSESEIFCLLVAKRSNTDHHEFDRNRQSRKNEKLRSACCIGVTISMDESQKLQGKFTARQSVKQKHRTPECSSGDTLNSFFENIASSSGNQTNSFGNLSEDVRMLGDQREIKDALEFGKHYNNLSIDLHFDDVSLLLPNKHVYEVIYNRLGNDMLLWLPTIFAIKEHLYNLAAEDPLQDPDMGFSRCFSGTRPNEDLSQNIYNEAIEYEDKEDYSNFSGPRNPYSHFPKSDKAGLIIHIDTSVSLAVKKAHISVCSPAFYSKPSCDKSCDVYSSHDSTPKETHCLFVANVENLQLKCVVGLEKDPEICLLSLGIRDGNISFGTFSKDSVKSLDSFHFNGNQENNHVVRLATLLQKTRFNDVAWQECFENQDLIKLTTKILFDSKNNFKTISLCMLLSEASFVMDLSSSLPPSVWTEWLAEFFTVVEYPVTGYIPPAILTEMRFDLKHCTVDISCDAISKNASLMEPLKGTRILRHNITIALGAVKVLCSLLDTGKDASISINCEDLAFYLGIPGADVSGFTPRTKTMESNRNRPSWVCICDLDLLELTVFLKDKALGTPSVDIISQNDINHTADDNYTLDVCMSCHLLRARTCVDTIALLIQIGKDICYSLENNVASQSRGSSIETSSKEDSVDRENPNESQNNLVLPQVSDEVIPDLADAMADLEEQSPGKDEVKKYKEISNKSRRKHKKGHKKGAQVFFFPNEGGQNQTNQPSKKILSGTSTSNMDNDFAQDLIPKNLGMTDSFYNMSTSMRLCSKNPEELDDDDNLIQIQNSNHFGANNSDDSSTDEDELDHKEMDESFFIVDRAIGSGVLPKNKSGEAEVRYLEDQDGGNVNESSRSSGVITLHENHFPIPQQSIDYLKAPKGFPSFKSRITLKQLSILWQIYGGRDFICEKRDQTVFNINASSAPDSVRADDTPQKSRFAGEEQVFTNSDKKTSGGLERNQAQLLEVSLTKISFQHEEYPEDARGPANVNCTLLQTDDRTNGHKLSTRQIALINSFEIRDRVRKSDINKLVHLYSSKLRPRQSHANMLSLKCVNIKPDYDYQPEESIITVSLQPLKLNVDQDTLFFIANFVSGLLPAAPSNNSAITATQNNPPLQYHSQPKLNTVVNNASVMAAAAVGIHDYHPGNSQKATKATVRYSPAVETIEITPEEIGQEASEELFCNENKSSSTPYTANNDDCDEANKREAIDDTSNNTDVSLDTTADINVTNTSIPIDERKKKELYIRSFIFARDVPIRIDYAAKYVDLNASASLGAIAGLLAGLTSLNCSELTLKRVCYNNGIVGIERLLSLLITEWLADIRQNQIPNILGGVGPMYSVLQLLQGIKDLFLLPIEQYQKDGRIIRGIQKGAHSFTSSTAMSFLDMTNRVLGVIKFAAEMAFEVMSPEGSIIQGKLPYHASSDPSASLYGPALGTAHGTASGRFRRRMNKKRNTSNIVKRPSDMREGMFSALAVVQEVKSDVTI